MYSVDEFRRRLASEVARITELCATWDEVLEQSQLPEEIQECVLTAVGNGRLLVSQKLQQFGFLVERCARPEPDTPAVTQTDLLGFWEMVYMQVENVYARFKKLEQLRDRGWAKEKPVQKKKPPAKPVARKSPPRSVPSRIKDVIALARRAKQEQEDQSLISSWHPVKTDDTESKLFEAVLSDEAKKASASKPAPLRPINLPTTRDTLQSANKNIGRTSVRVVLFDKSNYSDVIVKTEPQESPLN